MTFAKLLSRITESSLMEQNIATRYVFLMMLAIANEEGVVVGTEIAIARRLNMDLVLFQSSIANLTQPDEDSNSKEHGGRRIVLSEQPRGFLIVNYCKYKASKDDRPPKDRREYMRLFMQRKRNGGKADEPEPEPKPPAANGDLELLPMPSSPQPKAKKDRLPTTDTAKRIAAMKNRRLTTEWSEKEIKAYKAIGIIPEEDLAMMEEYYASGCDYLRRDMLTLLNHWQGEVDRAREFCQSKPKHRALQQQADPEGWREFLQSRNVPYAPHQHAKDYLKHEFRS